VILLGGVLSGGFAAVFGTVCVSRERREVERRQRGRTQGFAASAIRLLPLLQVYRTLFRSQFRHREVLSYLGGNEDLLINSKVIVSCISVNIYFEIG